MTNEDKKLIAYLKSLPADYWDFKGEDTKEYTHGIHNYPAMMICPISRNIIKAVKDVRPVNALFDPFVGSGTVLVEGMLSGIPVVAGNDMNPLARFLTDVKTTPLADDALVSSVNELLQSISLHRELLLPVLEYVDSYFTGELGLDVADRKGWGEEASKYLKQFCRERELEVFVPDFKNLGYWFRPRVILELSIIKTEIEKIEDRHIKNFAFIAMSEAIRFVSNRRNGEFKMFRMPPEEVRTFEPNTYGEFSKILLRNVAKMRDFRNRLEAIGANSAVSLFQNNACELKDVPDDAYDIVITSPPYGDSRTTVAYGEYSRLSLQWISMPEQLTESEIMSVDKSLMGGKKYRNGFEFSLKSPTLKEELSIIKESSIERAGDVYSFYADLDASIKNIAKKTNSGGYQFWVVGNRTVKNVVLQTDVIIAELAPQYGLVPIYTIDRNIPNKVMPSKNSPSNVPGEKRATMTMEHIVVLHKE